MAPAIQKNKTLGKLQWNLTLLRSRSNNIKVTVSCVLD